MIKTDRQYTTTKAQLAKLAAALVTDASAELPDGVNPRFLEVHRSALESQIEDLRGEIDEYDALRSGARSVIAVDSLADLPRALIQARIASGLTQRALARRLNIAEQQVQRYEATEYESASFSRLKEIARALDVDAPSAVVPNDLAISPRQFLGRLQELGFDKDLVFRKVLPIDIATTVQQALEVDSGTITDAMRGATTRAGALVARVLGLDIGEFFSGAPQRLAPAATAGLRYKQTTAQASRDRKARLRGGERRVDAYTVYAHYLALLLLDSTTGTVARELPDDPEEVRRVLMEQYADHGGMSLEGALHFAWDLGIPVLPLSDSGRFHGACWRVGGRNVIVLKQRTHSLARWLFDLLHEIRHAGQHPEKADFEVVEREGGEEVEGHAASDEEDAMQFAGDVLLAGRAEEITQLAVDAAGGSVERLKQVVPRVAKHEGVDVDVFANYLAHRLARQGVNWWGTANNLQRPGGDPFVVARDVFLARANLSPINPVDRQILFGALIEPDSLG